MKDFNFFGPYLMKKSRLSKKQLVLYISVSIIAIVLVAIPVVNQLIIKNIENETILIGAAVYSEEAQQERQKINQKQKQIQDLQNYYKVLESIDNEITSIDIINDLFIQTITDRVPEEVFFQDIRISQSVIQITGIAKNNISIAKFEQNLRKLPYFENVFIPNISTNTGGYTFTISFQIKGGIDDETN